jgi:hypothetical protein
VTTYTFPDTEIQPHARVIADSISPAGHRLTTMVVTAHRFVLAEFNTHRVFSRSSASSRAVPTPKTLAKVEQFPAWPLEWNSEKPGMQGGEPLTGVSLAEARLLFKSLAIRTVEEIQGYLHALEVEYIDPEVRRGETLHKSLLNRLLEPFTWHTMIITSTEWENFFRQRVGGQAQPEFRVPATFMRDAYELSKPTPVGPGDWHLPFITDEERTSLDIEDQKAFSVARCARVSYLNHDGTYSEEADRALYRKLCNPEGGPPHAAPLEHVATPAPSNVQHIALTIDGTVLTEIDPTYEWKHARTFTVPALGNFVGWTQLRHLALGF